MLRVCRCERIVEWDASRWQRLLLLLVVELLLEDPVHFGVIAVRLVLVCRRTGVGELGWGRDGRLTKCVLLRRTRTIGGGRSQSARHVFLRSTDLHRGARWGVDRLWLDTSRGGHVRRRQGLARVHSVRLILNWAR